MTAPHPHHPSPPPPPYSDSGPQDDRPPGASPYRHVPAPQDLGPPTGPPPLPTPTYHRRHRGFRLAGLAVVGVMVAGGVVSTAPEMVRDAEDEVIALPAGTVELDLRGDAGDVLLREVAAGQEPGITAQKHWSFREPETRVSTSAGVTSVSLDCPPVALLGQCYADWTVAVPEGMKVVVHASVGDVDVAGLTGEVSVQGSVGDVQVTGSPASLDVNTSVGRISADLDEPADSVRLRTSVGDVDLRLPEGFTYDVNATSTLDPASVQVETSQESDYDVEVSSSVGSVTISDG